jgi:predicted CXXCH cytochrome family protein
MSDKSNTRKAKGASAPSAKAQAGGAAKGPAPRRRFPLIPVLGGLVLLGALLAAGGFAFAANQEQHDAFCASCHTQPESTFYQRSQAAQPVDLASAHKAKNVTCINCHSGAGVTGRMSAEVMGARNAVLWYTGQATQPAPLHYPISDANCLKCHQEVTGSRSRDNHFHYFLARWQAVDPQAATCVSCHGGHTTDGSADIAYLNQANTEQVCQSCHNVLRTGD